MAYEYDDNEPTYGVGSASIDERAVFITRTYVHLLGAIVAFTLLEIFYFSTSIHMEILQAVSSINWLFVLGAFMIVSWIATHFAMRAASIGMQYLGLGLYIAALSVIFVPLLAVAESYGAGLISSAAGITLVGFAGLTAVAFITKKDFSFLRGIIMWGFIVAFIAIVAGVIFGFELGPMFSVAMIALCGAAILYDTSNVLHHYPKDRYVGAALELFASVAMMFWYVLRLLISLQDD